MSAGPPIESEIALGLIPPDTNSSGKAAESRSSLQGMQVMRLNLLDGVNLESLLKHAVDLKLSFGKSVKLGFGDQLIGMHSSSETRRNELYSSDESDHLQFVGMFTHCLEVRDDVEEGTPEDDEEASLAKSFALLNQEKAASTTMLVDSSELPPAVSMRQNRLLKTASWTKGKRKMAGVRKAITRPSSRSPALAQTDANYTIQGDNRSVELKALRTPLIHLLGLGPASTNSLVSKTRSSNELCKSLLGRIASMSSDGQWVLLDNIYKELDPWLFPYEATEDRDLAVANCQLAFDRMGLGKSSIVRKHLLAPGDRETSDSVSNTISKSGDDSKILTSDGDNSPMSSSTESKRSLSRSGKSRQHAVSRIINGKRSRRAPSNLKGPPERPPKNKARLTGTTSKQKLNATNKVKSAERIEDSDDDDEMGDVRSSSQGFTDYKLGDQGLADYTELENYEHLPLSDGRNTLRSTQQFSLKRSSTSSPPSRPEDLPKFDESPLNSAQSVRKKFAGKGTISSPKSSPSRSSPLINTPDFESRSACSSPSIGATTAMSRKTSSHSPEPMLNSRNCSSQAIPLKRKAVGLPVHESDSSPTSTIEDCGTIEVVNNFGKQTNGSSPTTATVALRLARKFKEDHAIYQQLYKEAELTTDRATRHQKISRVQVLHRELESGFKYLSVGFSSLLS